MPFLSINHIYHYSSYPIAFSCWMWFFFDHSFYCSSTCLCDQAMSTSCPHGMGDPCLSVEHTAYVERTTNIAPYSSIRLEFDVYTRNLEGSDSCDVEYQYDNIGMWR
eukprot:779328_1